MGIRKSAGIFGAYVKNGIYCKESAITLNNWFHIWIDEYKEPAVKKTTIETYQFIYEHHIKRTLGNKKLKEIRAEMIQRLYNSLNRQGLSKKTIDLVSTVLHGLFLQAYKNQMIQRNPVPLATIPKGKKAKEPRVMTLQEQKIFLKFSQKDELHDMYELFLSTGMRSGEIRGLDWKTDTDFNNKVIHVTGTLNYSKETGFRKDEPKTSTSYRDIPMLDNVVKLLKRIKRQQMEKKLYMENKWEPLPGFENLVFLQSTGKPIQKAYLKEHIDAIEKNIQAAGYDFDHITPHTFRHTFATRCIENGMSPQVLKSILGHSKLSMTMDLYAHVLPDTKAKEMEKIANLF